MDKKALLWPVIISVFIHVTLLAVTGTIDLREHVDPLDVLSVSIKEIEPELKEKPAPQKENKITEKTKAVKTQKEKGIKVDDDWREDTVDLGSSDIKYVTYLAKIKEKILRIWKYPPKAYEKNEEGNVIIRISIDADGRLSGATVVTSSGSTDLDYGSLSVVTAAAPFEPLPEIYNLSRLHIVASFNYKIMD
jgi:TonB family protein